MLYYMRVQILKSEKTLQWGELDLPVWGLEKDWHGAPIGHRLMFSLAMDTQRLWFIAASTHAAKIHPAARPVSFTAELWRYDCAELFIHDPQSGRYLEFNLAANSAWWSCEFLAPRVRAEEIDIAFPEVATFADLSIDGGWMVAMSIPLDILRARLRFGEESKINVSFTTGSPNQQYVSATKLPGNEADFHQPQYYSSVNFHNLTD
jgi:hypothetical protein